MSTEQNKATARRLLEEVWNKGNLKALDENVAPGAPNHDPNNPIAPGPEGLRQVASLYRSAIPDLRFKIEQEIAEGDFVVQRITATGTQRGDLPGIPATGKYSTVTGVIITRFKDGKVAEAWSQFDQLGMLQQLGVVPKPEEMATARR